jgi:hypothetical protein
MKIGDLVTLSSAGCKAQGNWRQRACATFGIIVCSMCQMDLPTRI